MSIQCWTVGFIGNGAVTEENTEALLKWLTEDIEVQALTPGRIPRTHKGLREVIKWLDAEDIPQAACDDPSVMLSRLTDAREDGEEPYLVILGTEDNAAVTLAEQALDAGIKVKDLCAALDDVEFEAEPEPPVTTTKRRGRARTEEPTEAADTTVQAVVDGPAALVPPPRVHAGGQDGVQMQAAVLLEQAIRTIIKEELTTMFPGAHAHAELTPEDQAAVTFRAYANTDGGYRLVGKRTRKKSDEEEVELTEAEARTAGLID